MPTATQKTTASTRIPLQVESRPIASLQPDPKNARVHSDKQTRQIAKSIETFGFNVPLLVDGAGKVLAGHGRLLACILLGWTEVPTITLEHLTPEQARAFAIADNQLTLVASWDEQLLAEQLKYLSEADLNFDLDAIGFELPEIDLRIQSLTDDLGEPEPDLELPAPDQRAISRLGDLWQLGRHRLLCGNALDPTAYAALLGDRKADVVFTDPPYNVAIQGHVCGNGAIHHREFAMAAGEMSRAQFTQFLTDAMTQMRNHSQSGAIHFVFQDWRHMGELLAAGEATGAELKNVCCWDKGAAGMGSFYRSQHELVFVFKHGTDRHTNNVQLGRFGRHRTNVWKFPGVNSFARHSDEGNLLALHPTIKPTALVAEALLDASERGEAVLDPFLGSGTTLLAAERTGRVGFGIELDPLYVDTAIRRWQRLTGQCAVHAITGERFDDVAARQPSDVPMTCEENTHG